MDKPIKWSKKKPKFDKECLLLAAHLFRNKYEYAVYQIIKIESDEGWYWGWLTGEGDEEYGDLADLKADLYCIMPLLKNQ